ncbi:hypothetical protein L249_6920 [Ophiocordyceps polyrhachis-furcata BCC 54312]|uniref:Uncharacterized protein n=1 Tax=Ophiocordyceps polyrhachis-furcata BCC 54312 TaxID=1330021 RepID=A0A367LLC6_9HYPO|nr:hypothetical protein L249_6920 [Ophiocordyceps polyrhachis-furcata BCC 54312]
MAVPALRKQHKGIPILIDRKAPRKRLSSRQLTFIVDLTLNFGRIRKFITASILICSNWILSYCNLLINTQRCRTNEFAVLRIIFPEKFLSIESPTL